METEEHNTSAYKAFTDYLIKNGLKKSQERYAILEAASQMEGIFTASDVYSFMLNNVKFHLSLATVYSTLELLSQCGIVVEHFLSAKSVSFEYAFNRTSFTYMICSKCGKTIPFHDRALERTLNAVKTPRLHVCFYKTYIYGVCAACARKEKSKLRKINNDNKK